MQKKFSDDKKAEYFVSEVINERKKLNNSVLRREKYNLIKSLKENYDSFQTESNISYKINEPIELEISSKHSAYQHLINLNEVYGGAGETLVATNRYSGIKLGKNLNSASSLFITGNNTGPVST